MLQTKCLQPDQILALTSKLNPLENIQILDHLNSMAEGRYLSQVGSDQSKHRATNVLLSRRRELIKGEAHGGSGVLGSVAARANPRLGGRPA